MVFGLMVLPPCCICTGMSVGVCVGECVCVCVSNISDHLMLLTDHIHTVRGIGTGFSGGTTSTSTWVWTWMPWST